MIEQVVEVCWICLDSGKIDNPLQKTCGCNMYTHRHCLAKWQMSRLGGIEEIACRFCGTELPDWKTVVCERFKAPTKKMSAIIKHEHVYVKFYFENRTRKEFKRHVCDAFDVEDLDLTFEIPDPIDSKHVLTPRLSSSSEDLNVCLDRMYDGVVHLAVELVR